MSMWYNTYKLYRNELWQVSNINKIEDDKTVKTIIMNLLEWIGNCTEIMSLNSSGDNAPQSGAGRFY